MKKNIALFVSFLDNEFSMDIIDGAWLAAEELDVNLFIMPTRLIISNYSDTEANMFEYQYNTMFSYVDKGNFDGAVVETGIICNGMTDEDVKKLFDSFGIPTVSIARKIEGYPNIRFNCNGLRDEIQHLIDVHGCSRIGFIGGPAENAEAKERFELYKQTLADNGIPFDEKLYGMGNFSEYCEDEVRRVILTNKGDIDALCFANDRMAIGGYKVIEELGMVVGKDIRVTGFDDAPSAAAMEPALTTVRSNVPSLGQHAVEQCLNMINEDDGVDVNIDTSIIVRSSCGCPSKISIITKKISADGSDNSITPEKLCDELYTFLASPFSEKSEMRMNIRIMMYRFTEFLKAVAKPDFSIDEYIDGVLRSIEKIDFVAVAYNEFSFALSLIRKKALATAYDKAHAEEFFFSLIDRVTGDKFSNDYDVNQNYRRLSTVSSGIIYFVLANINNESASYLSIITNVHNHGSLSSYLFIHEFPIVCNSYQSWHRPRTERLICYHDGNDEILLPTEEQQLSSDSIFKCDKISDERHTYFANPLFYNDEHYGLLVSEMDKSNYCYLAWVILNQISYALKMKQLMEEQATIRDRLAKNMELVESYNKMLRQKTISDELTGIFNRRGFMESVSELLSKPSNYGRKAVIAFADMNSLKVVNDRFGHDEGDFAIRGVAEILSKCFRASDIVARFGGDEFACFCFIKDGDFEGICRRRIKEITESFNAVSGKPYLVTLSIGIYEFICDADTKLTECMNTADALLYEDKKHKPESIMR